MRLRQHVDDVGTDLDRDAALARGRPLPMPPIALAPERKAAGGAPYGGALKYQDLATLRLFRNIQR
jgi:hypothetical protein